MKPTDRTLGKGIVIIYFLVLIGYLYWRSQYTLPYHFGLLAMVSGVLLLGAEIIGFVESLLFYLTVWDVTEVDVPSVSGFDFPDVDVYIATYNEPQSLLYKTVVACKNMDYPDCSKVHIYVCDDGNRSEISELCSQLNVGYINRLDNLHAKAGNLNNALKQTKSPLVATFDADMIPRREFLIRTVPFFVSEERVGFVQTPQTFYNPDPFQYNLFSESAIPNEQELFSKKIQMGKNKHNAIIYAGSNTVLSRKALDEIGGFAVGTITEDFATGMLIQSKKYKSIYLNEELASGLSPESIDDLFNQRIRWGRGVVQTFKKYNPFRQPGLTIMQKLLYMSALMYWYFGVWRLIFLVSPIMFSVFGIVVLQANDFTMMAIWVPMYILSNISFRTMNGGIRTTSWSHVYDTILFPHIARGVILETIGLKMANFKVTPKHVVTREMYVKRLKLVRVQIILLALSIIGLFNMLVLMAKYGATPNYMINTFWLGYNSYLLAMAVLFSFERPKFRNVERIPVQLTAMVSVGDDKITGVTRDLSEGGVNILFERIFLLNPDEQYEITVSSERYQSTFTATLIHAGIDHGKAYYSFKQCGIDEAQYDQLLLLLYDRAPLFPKMMQLQRDNRWTILRTLRYQNKKAIARHRRNQRVIIERDMVAEADGAMVTIRMIDCNGFYCTLAEAPAENLTVVFNNKEGILIGLSCHLVKSQIRDKTETYLFKINNPEDAVALLNDQQNK